MNLFYREKAEQALWFAETYGLTPQSIQFKNTKDDAISLNLNNGKWEFPFLY